MGAAIDAGLTAGAGLEVGEPSEPEESPVPVASLRETLDRAFTERYGVPAINIVNDLTIEAVLAAAVEERSPVIIQTSVKTVKMYGARASCSASSRRWRATSTSPSALHLDHCPDRVRHHRCLEGGWSSVLFDAHELDVAENLRQTTEVVEQARARRRRRRGRDRGHPGRGGRHRQ